MLDMITTNAELVIFMGLIVTNFIAIWSTVDTKMAAVMFLIRIVRLCCCILDQHTLLMILTFKWPAQCKYAL